MIWHPEIQDGVFLFVLDLAISFISFIASLLMCFYCIRTMSTKSASLKLILAIAISDFVFAVSNIMSAFQDSQKVTTLCYVEAILRVSSFILSIIFTTCIGILCYKACSFSNTFNQRTFFKAAMIIAFTVTTLYVTRPLYLSKTLYTNEPLFCWIASSSNGEATLLLTLFDDLPILLGLGITLTMYIAAMRRVKNLPPQITAQMGIHVKKLFWYPLVLFGTIVPSLVDNFLASSYPNKRTWLIALHFILTHSSGLTNAIVYGIQRRSQPEKKIEAHATMLSLTESFECGDQDDEL